MLWKYNDVHCIHTKKRFASARMGKTVGTILRSAWKIQ